MDSLLALLLPCPTSAAGSTSPAQPEYDWNMTEIQAWLDSELEPEDMSLWEGMCYTPYGPPIEFYEGISGEDSDSIGLTLVEGDHPGSSFAGVQLFNTPRDANRELQRLGINVVVGEG